MRITDGNNFGKMMFGVQQTGGHNTLISICHHTDGNLWRMNNCCIFEAYVSRWCPLLVKN